jgi:hypothetical protein
MRFTSFTVAVLAMLLASAPSTAAQELPRLAVVDETSNETATTRGLRIPADAVERGTASLTPAVVRRDSVKNGVITGAVIGGVAAALFGIYICNAVGEEGDPPCWRGVLAIGAIGAGVGAAAGAAIDAARSQAAPVLIFKRRF